MRNIETRESILAEVQINWYLIKDVWELSIGECKKIETEEIFDSRRPGTGLWVDGSYQWVVEIKSKLEEAFPQKKINPT